MSLGTNYEVKLIYHKGLFLEVAVLFKADNQLCVSDDGAGAPYISVGAEQAGLCFAGVTVSVRTTADNYEADQNYAEKPKAPSYRPD